MLRAAIFRRVQTPARHVALIGFAALGLGFIAEPAHAQDPASEAGGRGQQAEGPAPSTPPEGEGRGKKADLLFAPVPFSNPSTGTGVAGGVIAFYNPNNGPQQWISGVGLVWTERGSKGAAAFHSMSLDDDRFRGMALISYFDAVQKFFGIGEEDGDRGDELELVNKTFNAKVHAQMRVFPGGYAGVQYRLTTTNARPRGEPATTLPPPQDEMDSTLSMLGPTFTYDTRDSQLQPHRGVYANASWLFGIKALGNTFKHDKLTLVGSAYFPFGPDTVLAANARLCAGSGEVPYYDLCLFGSSAALRGYTSGRYRDRASWAIQGELRHRFARRWGGAAFFGMGGIAPSFGTLMDEGNLLPAAGAGIRYLPFRGNDVQLRLDVAVGYNSHGIYLGIGEAF